MSPTEHFMHSSVLVSGDQVRFAIARSWRPSELFDGKHGFFSTTNLPRIICAFDGQHLVASIV